MSAKKTVAATGGTPRSEIHWKNDHRDAAAMQPLLDSQRSSVVQLTNRPVLVIEDQSRGKEHAVREISQNLIDQLVDLENDIGTETFISCCRQAALTAIG